MIYGVFCGCYSDWSIVGYFDNRLDADKYCTAFGDGDYYVIEIKNLKDKEDLSKISLKYNHEVVFDSQDDNSSWTMRDEPNRYNCYISDELKPNSIEISDSRYKWQWVNIHVNILEDDRKLAEKIAQDYLYKLLSYGDSKRACKENVNLMNEEFLVPYKIKEELKRQEELKQKELDELARLKARSMVKMNLEFAK